MKVVIAADGIVVELSRRNLTALLAKLDGNPPGSERTLAKEGVAVRAVEDAEHYSDREPGLLHPLTVDALRRS